MKSIEWRRWYLHILTKNRKTFYFTMKSGLFLFVTVLLSLPLRADWQWQNDLVTATVLPHEYTAIFSFKNTGKTVVAVTKLTFSCPCIVYRFHATPVGPGKTGTLAVYIARDPNELFADTINLIVSGSPSTKSRELTVRVKQADPAASR
jgi:hypothetical protein